VSGVLDRNRLARHPLPRPRLASVSSTGERAQQIARGEDADQPTEVGHERRANIALAHPLSDLAERVLGRDDEHLGRHEVANRPVLLVAFGLLVGKRESAGPGLRAREFVRAQLDLDANGAGRGWGRLRLAGAWRALRGTVPGGDRGSSPAATTRVERVMGRPLQYRADLDVCATAGARVLRRFASRSGVAARSLSFEPTQHKRSDGFVVGVDAGVAPGGSECWIVEAGGGVERGAGRDGGVRGREGALLDAVGDDPGQLGDEGVDVCLDDVACVCGQLDVGGEELGVVERVGCVNSIALQMNAFRSGAELARVRALLGRLGGSSMTHAQALYFWLSLIRLRT
jgi:hypothetical protein